MNRPLAFALALSFGSVAGLALAYGPRLVQQAWVGPAADPPLPASVSLAPYCHDGYMEMTAAFPLTLEPAYLHRYWTTPDGTNDYDLASVRLLPDGRVRLVLWWRVKPTWMWQGRLDTKDLPPEGIVTTQETCR